MAKSGSTSTTPLLVSSMASIPSLHAFDSQTSSWQSYRDRIHFYFKANRIDNDEDKKALFLWSVGDITYNLLESLISPRLLTADTTTFDDLLKVLNTHFDTTKSIMTSTYDFYSCYQKPGQSFSEWKADLCERLRHCAFTTSCLHDKPQDRALRDMYIIGIRSQKIRQALLKEKDPDLESTEKIILLAERLEQDVRHFDSPRPHVESNIDKLNTYRPKPAAPQRSSTKQHEPSPCQSCGSTKHLRSKCRFRESICNFCKRSGHLERVCRQRLDKSTCTKHIITTFKLNNNGMKSSITLPLIVNHHDFIFELDTGTCYTIVGSNDWQAMGSPKLNPCEVNLKCYSGHSLRMKGQSEVDVHYNDKKYKLSLLVVHGTRQPLLGLQWMKAMHIDLTAILQGTNDSEQHVHHIGNSHRLQSVLNKHKHILDTGLGHCTKVQAHIQLTSGATPKFFKPRPIPFAYLDGVKEEIHRNVEAGILTRVDTSDWAAPIVPIKKPNGKIRICGDFKVTINPHILVDQHPIPSIDEIFARLNNGKHFSKLDLSDAYLQVELDESSKRLVVINTPLGLFRYNRMPFGISNAPAIFQRIIDQVIAGIPTAVAYLDDILITGADEQEHLQTLELVLQRLSDFGFHCNPDKCLFFQDEVSYLGFVIDRDGKRPDPRRVKAILEMPPPTNIKELEAFIGKVNYYGKFISNFSDKCKHLNDLRKQHTRWVWSHLCQHSFEHLLREIATTTTLVHFDQTLPIVLATDASNYGVGAVISHRYADGSERPIAHASKTLTIAEQKYSQIEKEAFSIIFGIKKFHQYLAGRSFELLTDHKPLITIFNPSKSLPITSANRIQRWAIFLMGYNYSIRYKPTSAHANADALSRLPLPDDNSFTDDDSFQINSIQNELSSQWPLKPDTIAMATTNDPILAQVRHFTLTKWPCTISRSKQPKLIPYFNTRHSLSVLSNCLLQDTRVIIPEQLQHRVIRMLHRGHPGVIKMKHLARAHCWWPGMDKDIIDITQSCHSCAQSKSLPKPKYKSWDIPSRPWSRLHIDFAGPFMNSKWLILVDATSKFPIVVDMQTNTSAARVREVLEEIIDCFGPPESIVTDNGPPFNSHAMNEFYAKYAIDHITTPPYHPASNGLAERFVRTFKEGMCKERRSGQLDKNLALRNVIRAHRWTPHTSTGRSPANMIFNYSIRTEFDIMKPRPQPEQHQQLPKYSIGQPVWSLQPHAHERRWHEAIITNTFGSMIYEVQLNDGQYHKRHQNQLRPRHDSRPDQFDSISLPDDLANTRQQPNASVTPPPSPRYPRRHRKPPNCYSPT